MENDSFVENKEYLELQDLQESQEFIPEKSQISTPEQFENIPVYEPATRINLIQKLAKNLKVIKEKMPQKFATKQPLPTLVKSYGLGAYPPPQIKKTRIVSRIQPRKIVFPKMSKRVTVSQTGTFFETILMVIIILFLLRWLFGFNSYRY
ncbi:MAG: hypothetical protein ACOYJ1_07150 [Peptococcales bacterium]|jgi:hypothetical protein